MTTVKPPNPLNIGTELFRFRRFKASSLLLNFPSRSLSCKATMSSAISSHVRRMVESFDPSIPLQEAATPPSCWYTEPSFLDVELERVFYRGWQAVGYAEQIDNPKEYFTGRLGSVEFVVCRDATGKLHAYHNVCRHHASLLASGCGKKSCFVCPYHGWTYGLDGTLLKATRSAGLRDFNVNEFGLIPINVASWGPFILINLDKDTVPDQKGVSSEALGNEWLGRNSSQILGGSSIIGFNSSLKHVRRRQYTIECNWKVYCDNYLDGGYHVPYAHGGLASALNLDSYSITNFDKVSIQSCESTPAVGGGFHRLGSKALYAFVYPNFMINRYGPWLDTNLVLPLTHRKCLVTFDYFLEDSLKDDEDFIERSLEESERVQIEDIALCEGVQKGLESPAYCTGRYAPTVEKAMHHFHSLLHHSLIGG
ncbi:hypothetical protein H6P81_000673 [Aristolochia fimbriata]|uniref:Choline monooxygenase, chloroplastic n=1 Tax=Aristolochia fimbriata TaxID=158543 RepID=A0AAV7F4T2_ARIFI|nr:hypothetical protein H6P81_000673 [Aristolochia fimbriata]